jgi:hypothetical protein
MPRVLSFASREVISFADLSYRWIDIASFGIPTDAESDGDLIGLLLADPRFADTYDGPRELWQPGGHEHGPYRLEGISVEDYQALGPAEAKAYIGEFVRQSANTPNLTIHRPANPPPDGKTPREIEAQLASMVDGAQSAYRLRDLGAQSHHEGGEVLWFFHELVLLDWSRRMLHLLVAAVD